MKVLILGNMANDGYAVAKEMRAMHFDVDLAVNVSDFGMALPEWEEGSASHAVNPYSMQQMELAWKAPDWIRYFDMLNKVPRKTRLLAKIRSRLDLFKMMRKYDVIETHVPYAMYAQFSGIPYVAYDAGWIRYFPQGKGWRDALARSGYGCAKSVMITNPDTLEITDRLEYTKKVDFVPFAINPEKYRPMQAEELRNIHLRKGEDLLLFSPSRQIWKEKGNDRMLYAFARFVKEYPNARFVMVGWSIDFEASKSLVKKLHIDHKIDWIAPVPKEKLIEYYNAADIVLDQFILGSWGTSTPEAMCCGKPVVMYYNRDYIMRAFGEHPPICNAYSEGDIEASLLYLAKNKDVRIAIGQQSRAWIIKTHHPRSVAERHMRILETAKATK